MATKEQHFVPRVYLKQWEGTVATLKEPNKQFTGVYYFDSDSFIGDGKNTGSILWKPHLYTINFDQIYIAEQCPLVYADFVSQVYSLMREREPAPVYGKLGYSNIKTRESVRKHLSQVDTWTFFYYDGNLARSGVPQHGDVREEPFLLHGHGQGVRERCARLRRRYLHPCRHRPLP